MDEQRQRILIEEDENEDFLVEGNLILIELFVIYN